MITNAVIRSYSQSFLPVSSVKPFAVLIPALSEFHKISPPPGNILLTHQSRSPLLACVNIAFPLAPCCWSVCISSIIHSYLGSHWNKRFHGFKYMPKQTHLGLCVRVCEREMARNRVCRGFSLISHMRFCAEALMLAPKEISF